MGDFSDGFEGSNNWYFATSDIQKAQSSPGIASAYEGSYFASYEENNNDNIQWARYQNDSNLSRVEGYFYWAPTNTNGYIDIGVGVRESNGSGLLLTYDGTSVVIREGDIGNSSILAATSVNYEPSDNSWRRVDFKIDEDSNGDVTATFELDGNIWSVGPVTPSITSAGNFVIGCFQGINTGGSGGIDDINVTDLATSPPSQPQNVNLTYVDDDQLTFDWDEVNDWGGETGSYDVQILRDGGSWVSPSGGASSVSGGSASYSKTYGPNSDNSYDSQVGIDSSFQFRVRATNSAGSSSWVTSGTVYTTPIPPHNPSVSRPDANTIEITATVKSDIPNYWILSAREDSGNGYGNWRYYDTVTGGESFVTSGHPGTTGDVVTLSMSTDTSFQSGNTIDPDKRYQFRITQDNPDRTESSNVFADYGNNGNVYFEDDFESNDLSAWDSTTLTDGDSGIQTGSNGDMGINGAEQGTYYVRLDSNDSVTKNLGDLSGESNVIVKATVATGSMDNISSEQTHIEFYDGATWQTLRTFGSEYNKQGWVEVTALVPQSQLSTDNRVRFRGYGGGSDYFGVDRVVVSDIVDNWTDPVAPSGLSLTAGGQGELDYSWTDNSDIEDSYIRRLRRSSQSNWQEFDGVTGPDGTTHTDTGLLDGEEYEAQVYTRRSQYLRGSFVSNWQSYSSIATATTPLPSPTSLTDSSITTSSFDVDWTANHNYGDQRMYRRQTGSRAGMAFDASGNDKIVIDTDGGFTTQSFTASIAVKSATSTWNGKGCFGRRPGFLIHPNSNGTHVRLYVKSQVDSWVNVNAYPSEITIPHVYTVRFDASAGVLEGFLDGESVGTVSGYSERETNSSNPLLIGEDNGEYLDGTAYWATFHTKALSNSQVSSLGNGELVTDNLHGYWPLDQNNGGTTPDVSTYANDGTVNGATLVGNTPTDVSGSLARSTTSYSHTTLTEATQYETFVQAETEHSKTRDY